MSLFGNGLYGAVCSSLGIGTLNDAMFDCVEYDNVDACIVLYDGTKERKKRNRKKVSPLEAASDNGESMTPQKLGWVY